MTPPNPRVDRGEDARTEVTLRRNAEDHGWVVGTPASDAPFFTTDEKTAIEEVLQGILDLGGEVEYVPASLLAQERERAESDQCVCGIEHRDSIMAGSDVVESRGAPKGPECRSLTWKEVLDRTRRAAGERRREAKDLIRDAVARATRAEGERDEATKARNAMSHGFDELQESCATLRDKIDSLEEDVAEFSAEARVAKDERDATKRALDGLIDAATSIVFPDGDHGAEQSLLAKALIRALTATEREGTG